MSTAKFDTLSTLDGSQSVPVNTVAQGSAKAWVNFNGTGTVAIRASFNVSSITDNGAGDYTVNFTTALLDANYAAVVTSSAMQNSVTGKFTNIVGVTGRNTTPTTSALRVFSGYTTGTFDEDYVNVAIFR
jgi:hypothetical protein